MTPETSSPPAPAGQHAITLLAAATVLALLYFGREVLVPIVLALFLSLLIEPWVRLYRRLGLGHGPSVLVAVLAAALVARLAVARAARLAAARVARPVVAGTATTGLIAR